MDESPVRCIDFVATGTEVKAGNENIRKERGQDLLLGEKTLRDGVEAGEGG